MQRDEEDGGKSPEDCDSSKVEQLSFWLSHFVIEVRREDWKPCPPAATIILAVRPLSVSKCKAPTDEVVYLILWTQGIQVDGSTFARRTAVTFC